jgi:hypothetical protein
MNWQWSEGQAFRDGVSPELAAMLRAIAEAEIKGQPRFAPWDAKGLAAAVIGRCYAPDLLEVCHLVTVAQACGQGREGYERLFWGSGLARPSALRGFIADKIQRHGWRGKGFALADTGVEITAADGKRFTVNYRRMPYLCAMMDFAVSALGFPVVDDILRPLLDALPPPLPLVAATANALARALHFFLKDHLGSQQQQGKFSQLIGHLIAELGDDFDPSQVDDAVVLSFWLAATAEADFKTFESVLRAFCQLLPALAAALRQSGLDGASPMGKDGDAGEIDPDLLARPLSEIAEEDWISPLILLQEAPAAAIKFLNKQEVADLTPLVEPPRAALRLPLSVLRADVFGRVQRRLTEALRGKADTARLLALIAEAIPEDYAARRSRVEQVERHMDKMLLASLHALVSARHWLAVVLARDLAPDINAAGLARRLDLGGKVVLLRPVADDPDDPVAAALLRDAQKAHQGLNRQGFDRLPAKDDELCEAFEAGVPALQTVLRDVAAARRRLAEIAVPERFEQDQAIFRQHFARLYGGQS